MNNYQKSHGSKAPRTDAGGGGAEILVLIVLIMFGLFIALVTNPFGYKLPDRYLLDREMSVEVTKAIFAKTLTDYDLKRPNDLRLNQLKSADIKCVSKYGEKLLTGVLITVNGLKHTVETGFHCDYRYFNDVLVKLDIDNSEPEKLKSQFWLVSAPGDQFPSAYNAVYPKYVVDHLQLLVDVVNQETKSYR
jgi:hypothetical protein